MRSLLDRLIAGRYRAFDVLQQRPDLWTFRATDLHDGQEVVLQATRASALSPSSRLRLEHEATILKDVRSPWLSPVLSAGRDDGMLYVVTAPVPGTSLRERLDTGPLEVEETLAIARSLLEGLKEAHERGVLHRDLRPGKIFLHDGGATLAEFALSPVAPDPASAPYAAPEQAGLLHSDVGERADLYSLGVVLYECLAGSPPFAGETLGDTLRRHLGERPPALRSLGLPVPAGLDALIARLIRMDPRDRYQSAASALQDVQALQEALEAGREASLVPGLRDSRHLLTDPGFVGRHEELASLTRMLQRATEGRGCLVLVEAESGGGKSWLLEEMAVRCASGGALVLRARGRFGVAPRPMQLLEEALQGAGPLEELRTRLGDDWPAVHAALTGAPDAQEFRESRTREALLALLHALGTAERPAVLLLDDCQWADETTLRLACRWTDGGHTLLVLAFRSEEADADHVLRTLRPALHLQLAPMKAAEVRALAESMAGPLPEEALRPLLKLSEGNPFLAAEVLRGMVETGALVATPEGWRAEPALLEEVRSSDRAAVLLTRRLGLLTEESRRLLAAGAVLGHEFDLESAAALADVPAGRAIEALDEARKRHILWAEAGGTRFAFLHDRLREEVLGDLDEGRLRELHLKAASHLEEREPDRAYDLAWHFDAAGQPGRALPHALEAARRAVSRCALEVAEGLYRVAERGARERGESLREALQGLGEVLLLRGSYADAARRLEEARELSTDPVQRAWLQGRLGELAFKRGDVETARAALEVALRDLGHPIPRHFALALPGELARQALHSLFPKRFMGRKPLDESAGDLLAARLYSRLAHVYWFRGGNIPCFWAHLREMNLAEAFPPTRELAQAWSEHGPAMTLVPWFSRGERYVNASLEIRRSLGDRWGEGQSHHFYGVVLYAASRFPEALEHSREAVRILERAGDRWEVNNSLYQMALSQYRLGDLPGAVATARRLYAAAREIGDHQSLGLAVDAWSRASEGAVPARMVRSTLERVREDELTTVLVLQADAVRLLAEGRPREAALRLQDGRRRVRARGMRQEYVASLPAWEATAWRQAAEAVPGLAPADRRDLLRRAARACGDALRQAVAYRNNAPHAWREAGLLAALRGRQQRAGALLDRSLREALRQGQEFEAARTRLERARLEAALGRPGAEADLERAREAFRKLLPSDGARVERPVTLSLIDRFHAIVDAGRQIVSAQTEEAVLRSACAAAAALLRADSVSIVRSPAEAPPAAAALVARALDEGRAVRLEEEAEDLRSGLCVPIRRAGGGVVFLLATHSEVSDLFAPEETRLGDYLAALTGAALDNAEALGRMQGRSRTLEQRVVESSARLEASERRFRELVEGLDAVVWESDTDHRRFSFVSPRAVELFGHSAERWREAGFWRTVFVHPDDLEVALNVATEPVEYRARAADGRIRWVHDTARMVQDPFTGMAVLRGVMVDVTSRREAEQTLHMREEQLRQSQKMEAMGRLAGGVAHDFNNLLTAIEGYCDLALTASPPTGSPREELLEIQAGAGRAAALTRQLLSFSRRQIVAPRVLDLNDALVNVEKMLRRLIGDDVVLEFRTDPQAGAVLADPLEVEQVVLNLVLNARDAMPRGGKVVLGTRAVTLADTDDAPAPPGRYSVLCVEDSGVGMDEETRRRMFEPFFTTKEVGQGTGLGLATVYGIVRGCGGYLRVDSVVGRGTRMEIYLPRADQAGLPANVERAAPSAPRGGKETVLVAEDESTVRRLAKRVLVGLGYQVLDAEGGAEALALSRSHPGPIHLLVTDVVMPGLDGPELARLFQQDRPDSRVLYMSGYTADVVFRRGVETSTVDFLQKPFTPMDLAARVRAALDAG